MPALPRQELVKWFEEQNLEYPRTATVAQLKRLRRSEIERLNMTYNRPASPVLCQHSEHSVAPKSLYQIRI